MFYQFMALLITKRSFVIWGFIITILFTNSQKFTLGFNLHSSSTISWLLSITYFIVNIFGCVYVPLFLFFYVTVSVYGGGI
jgi:hypothetical protein